MIHTNKENGSVMGRLLTGLLTITLAVGASFAVCYFSTWQTKTMIIDLARVEKEADAYKSVVENDLAYKQKLIAQKSLTDSELKKDYDTLLAQKDKMSESDFRKKEIALQKREMELLRQYQFQAIQIRLATSMTLKNLQPMALETLQTVAREAGAGVVINKVSEIPYVGEKNDLTDRFIAALNRRVQARPYPNPDTIQPVAGGQ